MKKSRDDGIRRRRRRSGESSAVYHYVFITPSVFFPTELLQRITASASICPQTLIKTLLSV